jgi:pimeloyl-ACP methyl ester carboxylesterase
MPYVQIPGAQVYYEEMGVGEPLLFLHSSLNRGIIAFAAQFPFFQNHFRCILPDMRGHGRSISDSPAWTTPGLADDVPAMLDGLGIDSAHVIGYSLGGDVAIYAAARYPERFRSLVTIGAGAQVLPANQELADQFEPEALEARGERGFIALLQANHAQAHGGDWRAFVRQTIANWRRYPDLSPEELGRIRVPALFIAGAADSFVPAEKLAYLRVHVQGARTEQIAGCGHRPHMLGNRPDEVNQLILAFLRGQSSPK